MLVSIFAARRPGDDVSPIIDAIEPAVIVTIWGSIVHHNTSKK
jgi:hypothetical protein